MKSNKSKQNGGSKPNNGAITDNRFKHAQNDPKFKMYRRKDKAVQLDNRFGDLMKSNSSFTSDAPIDEYGRKIVNKKIDKSIKKTYVLENEEKEEKEEKEKKPKSTTTTTTTTKKEIKKPVVESESESESESEVEEEESINSDIESEKVIEYGGFEYNSDTESSDAEEFQGDDIEEEEEEEEEVPRGDATKRFAVLNCDWDNITSKQLFILLNSFVPSSGGGHIERITIYPSDFGLEQMAREKSLGPNKEIWDSSKAIINNSNNNGLKESSLSFDKSEDAESLDGKGFNLEKLRQYELSKLRYYYAVVECSSIQTANKIYDECEGMEIEDTANVLDLRFIPDDQKFTNTPRDTCTELPASTDENGGFGFQTSILKGTAVDFTWDIDKTRKKLLTKNFSKFDAREEDLRAYLADPTSSEESSEESSDDGDDNNNKNGKQTTKNSKRLALRNKYKSLLLDGIEDEEEKDDIQITFNSAFSDTLKQQKSNESDSDDDDGLSIKFSDQEIGSSDEEESDKEGIINKENDNDDESDSAADDESSENESADDDDDDGGDDDDDNLLNGSDSETPDWAKDLKSDSEDDTVQEMVINTNLNNVGKKLLKEKEKRENGNVFTDYLEKKKEKKSQKKRDRRIEIEKLIKEKEEKEKQQKKNKSKGRVTEEEKKEKAELELLLMDDDISKNKGYTKKQLEREAKMNTIDPIERKKLEKKLKKKNQKMDVQDDKHLIDLQGFKMNTTDNRFHSMFIDPAYAIDPTDPKFKRTTGMVEMLTEKKNRRKVEKEKEEKEILERRNKLKDQNLNSTTTTTTTTDSTTTTSKSSLSEMAQNIKRKAEEQKNKENSKKFKK
ncbi:hypothetical protein ACTFIR_004898 [Dictyostelium discoideum]